MGSRSDDGKGLRDFITAAMAGRRCAVAPGLDRSDVSYAFVGVAELPVRSPARMNHFLRFNLASGDRKNAQMAKAKLSDAAFIDLSLRNHLSLYALRSEHGAAFHLGTIIRAMFASFYLFDAGFGEGKLSIYTDADISLCELATSRSPGARYGLGPQAIQATAQLLELYDTQLRTTPLDELIAAHQCAERNFKASSDARLSIPVLVQRCRRKPQTSSNTHPTANF